MHPAGIRNQGLSLLSPSLESLFLFGASGATPVFVFGRWWTVLSAAWLHAGVLHIAFNMMWVRDLGPVVAHLYGPARPVITYTAALVVGFAASTLAGVVPLVRAIGPERRIGAQQQLRQALIRLLVEKDFFVEGLVGVGSARESPRCCRRSRV